MENIKRAVENKRKDKKAAPVEIPRPLIDLLAGSDIKEPTANLARIRNHNNLDPLNDSLGLGSLAGSPSLRTSHSQSQLETQLPPLLIILRS